MPLQDLHPVFLVCIDFFQILLKPAEHPCGDIYSLFPEYLKKTPLDSSRAR